MMMLAPFSLLFSLLLLRQSHSLDDPKDSCENQTNHGRFLECAATAIRMDEGSKFENEAGY